MTAITPTLIIAQQPDITLTPAAPRSLDLTLGERDSQPCAICGRMLAAIEAPGRFELEDADSGLPICDLDANRTHKGLRLVTALMNTVLDERAAGQQQRSLETVAAVVSALELLDEQTPRPAYRRPVRQQPVRHTRRGRRR